MGDRSPQAKGGPELRVLCLEDSLLDAELVREELDADGHRLEFDHAANKQEFESFLRSGSYDIVLADYRLPGFGAPEALDIARAVSPATPFICVSGTIGEEATVELLKQGADDCVLKDRLSRLPLAVERAIKDRAGRLALAQSEHRFRSLFEHLLGGFVRCRVEYDGDGAAVDFICLDANPAFLRLSGQTDVTGRRASDLVPDLLEANPALLEMCGRVARTGATETIEFRSPQGKWWDMALYCPEPGTFVALFEDVTERHQAVDVLRSSAERLKRTVDGTIAAMGAMVTVRDPYTAGHERRATQLAMAVAELLACEDRQREGLRLAGLVHDIGKLSVPAEILTKPLRLTEIEMVLVRQHPETAYGILSAIDFGTPVAEIVMQHHERMDGSGYPRGLGGDDIMVEARILAVADVVEAMASHRPYRPALGIEAALAEICSGAGRIYDRDAVDACERLFSDGFVFVDE